MKKALSIMMCYAIGMVALALNAAESADESSLVTSIDFSLSLLWGKTPRYGLDDNGRVGTQSTYYWHYCGDGGNQSIITNYAPNAKRYDNFGWQGQPNPQPEYMKAGFENLGYLDFICTEPLARTVSYVSEQGDSEGMRLTSDIFVDTLVRFVPRVEDTDIIPSVDVLGKAKFLCWMSSPIGSGRTNFVVTAGRYKADGSLERVNYIVEQKVKAGQWCRLTARTIKNASMKAKEEVPCFALYVDGKPLSCAAGDYQIGEDVAAMDDRFAGNELYTLRALFPPIRPFDEGSTPKMHGFAVQGRGSFDEFGMVNKGNPLAYESDTIDYVVSVPTNAVTNVTCTVTAQGGQEPYFTTNSTLEALVAFPVSPNDTIVVSPLANDQYSLSGQLAYSGNTSAKKSGSGYKTVMAKKFDDASALIAKIGVGHAYFRVGDTVYESVNDALDEADRRRLPLKLENDVTLNPATDNGQLRILPICRNAIVLDLCGRMIKGENFRDEATIYDQGVLTIIDSVGGGRIEAPGTVIEVASSNDALNVNEKLATLTVGDENVQNDFTVIGRVRCTQGDLVLKGGTYLTPPDESDETFYLADYTAAAVLGDERCLATSVGDRYWRVSYDERKLVKFEAELGVPVPAWTNVDLSAGKTLLEPAVGGTNAVGHSVTNWYVKGVDPLRSWNFATDEVTEDMTLVAQQKLDVYSITYDGLPGNPLTYSVKTEKTKLSEASKRYYIFNGWRDANSGHVVAFVGAGATFVDAPEVPVTGDLDLWSQWTPETLTWENVTAGNSESNGTYAGSWPFRIPAQSGLANGTELVIDEISFCIVNPHLYPKTAEYLAVTNAEGAAFSAARTYVLDEAKEYIVGTDWLENGRAKVSYRFEGLKAKVGSTYGVCFSSATGSVVPTAGFLRLGLNPGKNDAVFGNCTEPGGEPLSETYLNYCPIYEVSGHLEVKE